MNTSLTLLTGLFPPTVATEEGEAADLQTPLRPEEAACVEGAGIKRRQEFAAGRACAHRALARFGDWDVPVLPGEDRSPVWPPGLVGSIAHTRGYCGAAVARITDHAGLGLDIERTDRMQLQTLRRICTPTGRGWLEDYPAAEIPQMAALVFSAKESFFKAQHPLTRAFVGFQEAEIRICAETASNVDVVEGTFTVTPMSPGAARFMDRYRVVGRFRIANPFVATGIALPVPP